MCHFLCLITSNESTACPCSQGTPCSRRTDTHVNTHIPRVMRAEGETVMMSRGHLDRVVRSSLSEEDIVELSSKGRNRPSCAQSWGECSSRASGKCEGPQCGWRNRRGRCGWKGAWWLGLRSGEEPDSGGLAKHAEEFGFVLCTAGSHCMSVSKG